MLNLIYKLTIRFYLWLSTFNLDDLYDYSDILRWIAVRTFLSDYCKNTRINMKSAFPEKSKDELRLLEKAHLKKIFHFSVEVVGAVSFSNEEMRKRVTYKNIELLRQLLEKYKYVVCYSGHVANYEWMTGLPLEIPGYGMCDFYKSSNVNNTITEFIKITRCRYGARLIPTSSPLKGILKYKYDIEEGKIADKGFVVGTLSDMYDKSSNAHKVKLFNWTYRPYTGAERIGRRLNAAFLYGKIACENRGFYEITLEQLQPVDVDTNPFAYTDEFFRHLEKNICESPELWMMWGARQY